MNEIIYFPSSDTCIMVEVGDEVNEALNRRVLSLIHALNTAKLDFIDDIVPCWTGFGVYYRLEAIPKNTFKSPYDYVIDQIDTVLNQSSEDIQLTSRYIEIPVLYGNEFGPDLTEVAEHCKLTEEEVIELHGKTIGQVFMVGFAPGHPFIGFWDDKLSIPRRKTPRTKIPAGTIAIANGQTNIYPFDLPGGWNLIGRTPLKVFDVTRDQPSILLPGDRVKFVAISPDEFNQLKRDEV